MNILLNSGMTIDNFFQAGDFDMHDVLAEIRYLLSLLFPSYSA